MEQLKSNEFERLEDAIKMLEKVRARFGGYRQNKDGSDEVRALTNCNGFETVTIKYDENRKVFCLNVTNFLPDKSYIILKFIESIKYYSRDFLKLKVAGKTINVVQNNSPEDMESFIMLAMKQTEILLDKFWLFDWSIELQEFEYEIYGVCDYVNKAIILSMNAFALLDYGNIWNVIHHEVAHAIAGPGHAHDEVWEQIAKMIGCDGEPILKIKEIIKVDDNKYKVSYSQI